MDLMEYLQQNISIATVVGVEHLPGSMLGQKKLCMQKGQAGISELPSSIGLAWLAEQVAELVRENLSGGMFMVATVSNPLDPKQKAKVMIDPCLTPEELIILGGGHIAHQLVNIGRLLGYKITVVDDRPDVVLDQGLSDTDRSICCSFKDIEDVLELGPKSSVIIVTRGHMHDMDCLRKVVKHSLAYLGVIGSRRKIKMVREKLSEEGISAEQIDKIHMPIGLDIGAQTPAEIAVSIIAELIKVRRGGSGDSLKNIGRKADSSVNAGEMLSAVDGEILQQAIKAAHAGTPAALATIVTSKGSTPRKAGARMLIFRDGQTRGTIGGGCAEAEVRLAALDVIDRGNPKMHTVSLSADIAAMEGMACGGMLEVFVEPAATFRLGLAVVGERNGQE